METQEIKLYDAPELVGIEQSKAEQIQSTFLPMSERLLTFEDSFNRLIAEAETEVTPELSVRAKELRLAIAKVRIEADKIRKDQKAEYVRAGKAIDGVANILKWAVTDKENALKDIELHIKRLEEQRLHVLEGERRGELSKYYNIEDQKNLSDMEPDVWDAYLSTKKRQYEERIAAEKEAERVRVEKEKADAIERERVRIENEKLKAEAIERDRQAQAEAIERSRLAKIEADKRVREAAAEKMIADAKAKKVREDHQAKLEAERAEAARIQKIADDKLVAERAENDRLKAEVQARKDTEIAEKKRIEDARQAELNRGDKGNMDALRDDLTGIIEKYSFKSVTNQKIASSVYGEIKVLLLQLKGK